MKQAFLVAALFAASCSEPTIEDSPIDCEPTRQKMIAEQREKIERLKKPEQVSPTDPYEYAEQQGAKLREAEIAEAEADLAALEGKRIQPTQTRADEIEQTCRAQINPLLDAPS